MQELTIGQAQRKYSIAKSTFHNAMKKGILKFQKNQDGIRIINNSEIEIVFEKLIKSPHKVDQLEVDSQGKIQLLQVASKLFT